MTRDEDKQNTTQKTKKDEERRPHQTLKVNPDARERYVVSASYKTRTLLLIYFEAVNQIVMTTVTFL
jgi:hypothetical protein